MLTRNPADVAGRTLVFVWVALVVGLLFYSLPTYFESIRCTCLMSAYCLHELLTDPVGLVIMAEWWGLGSDYRVGGCAWQGHIFTFYQGYCKFASRHHISVKGSNDTQCHTIRSGNRAAQDHQHWLSVVPISEPAP